MPQTVGWPTPTTNTTIVWPLPRIVCTCGADAKTTHVCQNTTPKTIILPNLVLHDF